MKVLILTATLIAAAAALPRSLRKVAGGGRIVGGEDAMEGEFPYQGSLQQNGDHFCGCSLISTNWVLTAAHCVTWLPPSQITVVFGMFRRLEYNENQQFFSVDKCIVHEKYNQNTYANDIAIIRLSTSATITPFVNTIPLPDSNATTMGDTMTIITGWGTTQAGGSLSNNLQKVGVPVITDEYCRACYPQEKVEDSMICAGYPEGGKDSCQGDSGGPMVSNDSRSATNGTVVGIVSWGYGCAYPTYPGVYTEVACFVDWIWDKIYSTEVVDTFVLETELITE